MTTSPLITQWREGVGEANTRYHVYFFCEISLSLIPTYSYYPWRTLLLLISFNKMHTNPEYRRWLTVWFTRCFMDGLRIHFQPKVWFDRNYSTSWYTKIWKKWTTLKMSKTFIFHNNNNAETLLRNILKKMVVQ